MYTFFLQIYIKRNKPRDRPGCELHIVKVKIKVVEKLNYLCSAETDDRKYDTES